MPRTQTGRTSHNGKSPVPGRQVRVRKPNTALVLPPAWSWSGMSHCRSVSPAGCRYGAGDRGRVDKWRFTLHERTRATELPPAPKEKRLLQPPQGATVRRTRGAQPRTTEQQDEPFPPSLLPVRDKLAAQVHTPVEIHPNEIANGCCSLALASCRV